MRSPLQLKRWVDPRRPITYGIVQAGEDLPGGVPYIRPVDMTGHSGVLDPRCLLRTSDEIAAQYRRSSVRPGDIVVSIGPSFGKTMIVPDDLDGANLTQGTARIAPAKWVDGRYLRWALQSQQAIAHWESAVGGATFRALNLEPLSRTPVPSWPPDAQRAIVDFLDTETARIDALVAKKRRQVTLLSQRLVEKARHHTQVGTVLPARRHLAGVRTGTTPGGDDATLIGSGRGVEWISPGDIRAGLEIESAARRVDQAAIAQGVVPIFPAGSCVIVGIGATAGKVAFVDRDMTGNQQMTCLIPRHSSMNGRFLAWQLMARADELRSTAPYTTLPILNNDFLRSVPVWAPRLEEQEAVVRMLDIQLDRATSLGQILEAQAALLQEHRQALITAAVTGKLKVPGVAS